MTDFVEAVALDRIAPGMSLVVQVSGTSVALFNVDGTIYAINDTCAHAGASLGAGKIEGRMVTCRAHGLKYDITNGYVGGVPGFGRRLIPGPDCRRQDPGRGGMKMSREPTPTGAAHPAADQPR